MNQTAATAGVPPRHLAILLMALAATGLAAAPAAAVTQSWNGYRWSRTGLLAITVGNNVGTSWSRLLTSSASEWSRARYIDMIPAAGRASGGTACGAAFGTVQVCNGNYGANGWLGYTNVWLANGRIVQATVRLNDYYFAMPRYNSAAWRDMTMCHELGHTLGLAHADSSKSNLNIGSCMDYTSDPSGTRGTNGTLANIAPSASDFRALDLIYARRDATQLSATRPRQLGAGLWIDSLSAGVPEPGAWAMLIAGFGSIGSVLRRRRAAAPAAAA